MAADIYFQARREGIREVHTLEAQGEQPYLTSLAELVPELNSLSRVPLGVRAISIDQIAGTATQGRSNAFSHSFYPLLDEKTEFAGKWALLYNSVVEEGLRDPVTALEYYNRYYIVEGNKRVSVTRQLGGEFIEADVTRVIPRQEDTPRYQAYQMYLKFNADTTLDAPVFTMPQQYEALYRFAGREPGTKWERVQISELRTAYLFFSAAYHDQCGARPEPMPVGEAFLFMLKIHGYDEVMHMSSADIAAVLRRLWVELLVASGSKPAAMVDKPSEKRPSLVQSVLHPMKKVRCAFVYNSTVENSGWNYWHELGRRSAETVFGTRVETTFRENVTPENAEEVMEGLLKEGWDVIFAASPVFSNACIHLSLENPKARILNCSLLASYHHVRTYYLRIYEAKYVLGALAGILADDNKIGYIADYPICGVPASVNAFAQGVKLTNPRARVYLDWSTLPGHDPEASLEAQGVRLISGRDISAPALESRAFGLYRREGDKLVNLAMPMWNWGKLYQDIIRSILTGAWDEEALENDQALRYYMGMNTGTVDVVLSERIPAAQQHLCGLLKDEITDGRLFPFSDPVTDQKGGLRIPAGSIPGLDEVIQMNYLLDNVVGELPAAASLTEAAQRLVALHGLKED